MKKILSFVIAFVICLFACLGVSASEMNNVIRIENTEVIFDENSTLSDEMKQHIAEHFVYGDSETSTYGLTCTLFGHNMTVESITTLSHRVYDTAPRCLEEEWELDVCTRCDYMDEVRLGYRYVYCCD